MPQGRWALTEDQVAIEVYAVLMKREKAGRALSRADLSSALVIPAVYRDFLKICLEHDSSSDLWHFRRGLLFVVKAVGVSRLAVNIGLSRLSLYRMLSKDGNPRFDSFLALIRALGLHLWLVDD